MEIERSPGRRAGEALGMEIPEIPGINAVGDTVEAGQRPGGTGSHRRDQHRQRCGWGVTDAAADVGDTVTGTADQAAGAAIALRDKVSS